MPIYAYRCESCGHAQDVLQKLSDPQLSVCPACGAGTFRKQLTAAGFQLKGSGWYVTDFRSNSGGGGGAASASTAQPAAEQPKSDAPASTAATPSSSSSGGGGDGGSTAGGCGGSCACH